MARRHTPTLSSFQYDLQTLDGDRALDGADLGLAHRVDELLEIDRELRGSPAARTWRAQGAGRPAAAGIP